MDEREQIEAARARIAPYVHRTPLWRTRSVSERAGRTVHLKAELFQRTGSFKPRGMLNKLFSLDEAARRGGVITFSAGNAAQGLAYAAGIVGVDAKVAMPAQASPVKAEATRAYGAEVILHGTAADCFALCMRMVEEDGLTFVPSFDDMDLMIGHASLALELFEDLPEADILFVGVGGGGLIGGIAMGLRAMGSSARIIGVEPQGAAAMSASLAAGEPVALDRVASIADGLAPPFAGKLCYDIVAAEVEQVITVSDEAIAEAMRLLMARSKLMVEPAGAAALAGLLSGKVEVPEDANVVCILSGGNIDLERLRDLL